LNKDDAPSQPQRPERQGSSRDHDAGSSLIE
jgi:hypothetical protein